MDRGKADKDAQATVHLALECADALRRQSDARRGLESMKTDLDDELALCGPYTGVAAKAYAEFTSKVSRALAAAGPDADPPRRISEFSTNELLDELRRRHLQD